MGRFAWMELKGGSPAIEEQSVAGDTARCQIVAFSAKHGNGQF